MEPMMMRLNVSLNLKKIEMAPEKKSKKIGRSGAKF